MWPKLAEFGRLRSELAEIGQFGPNCGSLRTAIKSATLGASFAEIGQTAQVGKFLPKVAPILGPKSVEFGPNLTTKRWSNATNLGRSQGGIAEIWWIPHQVSPTSDGSPRNCAHVAELGPNLAEIGRNRTNTGRAWAKLTPNRPGIVELEPIWAPIGVSLVDSSKFMTMP